LNEKKNISAAITLRSRDPEVIEIQEKSVLKVKNSWVSIKIKAFGLNRSELFTRQRHSPNVSFPRNQGIECVGTVEEHLSGNYSKDQKVAAIMGGIGRDFDGGYAAYTLVPLQIVFPFESNLPWSTFGAIPEMFQTVSGSLYFNTQFRRSSFNFLYLKSLFNNKSI